MQQEIAPSSHHPITRQLTSSYWNSRRSSCRPDAWAGAENRCRWGGDWPATNLGCRRSPTKVIEDQREMDGNGNAKTCKNPVHRKPFLDRSLKKDPNGNPGTYPRKGTCTAKRHIILFIIFTISWKETIKKQNDLVHNLCTISDLTILNHLKIFCFLASNISDHQLKVEPLAG